MADRGDWSGGLWAITNIPLMIHDEIFFIIVMHVEVSIDLDSGQIFPRTVLVVYIKPP